MQEKYAKVAAKLEGKADALLVSTLDDIDWLLNLRGNDIAYNPVFISYLIFFPGQEASKHSCRLFIDSAKVSDEAVQAHLRENDVDVLPYDGIWSHLGELAG